MAEQRSDVISWDEFFMRVAFAAKLRSKDPNTQVGACIADTDHRILSVGYNGTPHPSTTSTATSSTRRPTPSSTSAEA